MKTTLLTHDRVIAATITALKSCGVRKKAEWPDAIAEVQVRALEWARARNQALPTDPEQVAKLCTTIAINWRIDETRKKEVRKEHQPKLGERPDKRRNGRFMSEPDRDLEDPVDVKRKLEVFLQEVRDANMPLHSEEIAVALAEGKTQEEIAQGLGVSENVVRYGASELRKRFRLKLAALGLLTVLTTMLVTLLLVPMAAVALGDGAPGAAHPSKQHVVHARVEVPEVGHESIDLEEMRELEAKPH